MCGIVGIVGPRLDADREIDNAIRMRDTMTHRGPDGSGLWCSPSQRAILGHRRLAIVDVSAAGSQPMANEDGTVWITYNGEIYNHASLRPSLRAAGHTYRSHTDTETILHLYEEHGADCVDHLMGMFAFAIWDERRERLLLVRDRVGIKPLYYTRAGGLFLFASEIKALLAHPLVIADADPQAMSHYLTFLTTPAPMTMFAGIHKLPPGHRAVLDAAGNLTVEPWWDALPKNRNRAEAHENAELLRDLLRDSVRMRMMSDVPFGVFLSGGVDSSTNVAIMSQLMSRPVDTYTVGFARDPDFNELTQAREIAAHFGTNHHEVVIDDTDLVSFLPQLIHHEDEPNGDPVCVPVHHVSRLAKASGTTVVQVGEGADELFCGYAGYMRFLQTYRREWRVLTSLPGPVRSGAGRLGTALLRRTGRPQLTDFVARAVAGEELFWGGAIAFWESDKRQLAPGLMRRCASSGSVIADYYATVDAADPQDVLTRMTYLDLKLRLPELLLMRVDKMSMISAVEARVPFLDHRIVEFAMGLSMDQKIHGGIAKHILKQAVDGLIPRQVIDRRKVGFGVPVSAWMREDLGRLFERVAARTALRQRDWLDFDHVDGLLQGHRAGSHDRGMQLWVLMNLMLWYDYWIAGRAPTW